MRRLTERGLTLIELLIALGLMSLVLGAVYTAFFASERAIRAYKDYGVGLHEARMLLSTLSRELKGALYNSKDPWTEFILKDRDLYGKRTSEIEFTTLSSTVGTCRVRYSVEESMPSGGEETTVVPFLLKKVVETPGGRRTEMSVGNVEEFLVRAIAGKEAYTQWRSEKKKALPEKFEIMISVRAGESIIRLKETVRPRMKGL